MTTQTKPEVKLKKLSASKIDLAKQPTGFEFDGKFIGFTEGDLFKQVDQKTGEVVEKRLTFATFQTLNGVDRVQVIADKGLQSSLKEVMVKEGMAIRIKKLDKEALKGGRTMNRYDIFEIQA